MSMPKSGRAVVIGEFGAPLEVREYPIVAPAPGEILVRMVAATLCGSDVHMWQGAIPWLKAPLSTGHEGVGEIVAFGDGPRTDSVGTPLEVGDRVVWEHEGCGHCYACGVLRKRNLCEHRNIGFARNAEELPHLRGHLAEYAYIWPQAGRLRVPDDVTSTWASASSCALRTVVRGMERVGALDYRHTVVIQGSGPLGLFATAVAASQSPAKLIVIGAPANRLEIAQTYGADVTISIEDHPDVEDRRALVREATGGRGADIVCEFSGGLNAFAEGIELLAVDGRCLVVGTVSGAPQPVPVSQITLKDLSVIGTGQAEIDSYYKALRFMSAQKDRFDWDLMTSGTRYQLDDATLAFERMQRFEETKAVFEPQMS